MVESTEPMTDERPLPFIGQTGIFLPSRRHTPDVQLCAMVCDALPNGVVNLAVFDRQGRHNEGFYLNVKTMYEDEELPSAEELPKVFLMRSEDVVDSDELLIAVDVLAKHVREILKRLDRLEKPKSTKKKTTKKGRKKKG